MQRKDEADARRERRGVNRLVAAGFAVAGLLVSSVLGWAAFAEIEGAVLGDGTVVSRSDSKRVQHRYGGTIAQIRVANGDRVKAGDVLMRLDGTDVRAELAILRTKMAELLVRRHRVLLERDDSAWRRISPALQKELDGIEGHGHLVQLQRKLFSSRRALRQSRISQLNERIAQFGNEIQGLEALLTSRTGELDILRKELKGLQNLRVRGLVQMPRLNALQRARVEKEGQIAETVADVARVRGKISETKLQIIELTDSYQSGVLEELEKTDADLSETTEKLRAAKARFDGLDITASIDGYVHELQVSTIGGVVAPGEVLATLTPIGDELVVDGRIKTSDRDQVAIGMPVRVRFSAFNQRTTPEAAGRISIIGSDRSKDKTDGVPYYKVRVRLDQPSDNIEIMPGMPAELVITSGARTVGSFLIKPLADQLSRAFREK
jgi:HlyD family type I secretion membrane fusion protein